MASKTKLFQVHFNLHLKPFNYSVWADYREDLHLTKAQLQKIPQLLKALQNKYKTMKCLSRIASNLPKHTFWLQPTAGASLMQPSIRVV